MDITARQAHVDTTPADYVSCRVRLSGHGSRRRSGQSAIHGSAGHCRFPILLLPVASATCCTTISDRGRFEIVGTSIYTLQVRLLQRSAGRNSWHVTQVKRLQSVQNVAARLVSGARRRDHITPVLRSLHLLPVRQRIFFKTVVLVWKKCK